MNCRRALGRVFILIVCAFTLAGCLKDGPGNLDEEKDPHYLEGLSKQNTMDFPGAAEAFQRALEANPHSASAHKKLGLLYCQQLNEPDAAIYHFRKLLQLRPNDPHADTIKQFIISCQQELARGVSIGPLTKQTQDELNRLTVENDGLKKQVEFLRTQLAQRPPPVTNQTPAQAAPVARPQTAVAPPASNSILTKPITPLPPSRTEREESQAAKTSPRNNTTSTRTTPASKTHRIRAGDTLRSIAPRYGVTVAQLTAANPGIDPRRLVVGQEIKIPAR
ncbi:MAG TPA: LysM peptidoglycan-binding domain-containing protein [Verrucomicrobiae bacterium]|nr:LysM peptidoglycan-binding domain-containing protein [Verrucomicrobiae bacterium]